MAFEPANIKSEMPQLAWRHLVDIPCELANISGSHVQAARPYAYLDVDANEPVRRNSETITARLFFFNTLQADLYPDRYRQFITSVRDKSAGDLVHPAHGFMRAVVLTYNLAYEAKDRAGVAFDVTWKEVRENANTPPAELDVPPDAKEVARDVDVQYEFVRARYPSVDDGDVAPDVLAKGQALETVYQLAFDPSQLQYPDGGGPQNFYELVVATFGSVQQEFIAFSGKFAQAAIVVEKISNAVELLQDPLLWPAQLEFRELHRAIVSLVELYSQGDRPTAKYTAEREMPLDEVADFLGKKVDDLIQLNPTLLSSPWVDKGRTVTYYLD
jgi:hypothetical protein